MFASIEFTLFDIDLDCQVWQRRRKMSWDAGTSCGLMYRLWREPSLGWHKFIVSPHRNLKSQNLSSDLSLFAEDKVLRVGWCHSCCNVASHNHPFFAPRWVVRLPQLLRRLKMFQTCPESKQLPETLGMMAPHSCCLPQPSLICSPMSSQVKVLKMFQTCLRRI